MIEPIIEYLPIEYTLSKQGKKWELFSDALEDGTSRSYLAEVQSLMNASSGIYIFYDSLGRAIYVGKAEKQNLWKEANDALNRNRGEHQTMFLVNHPENNVKRVIRDRKIVSTSVQLSHIASYFSAYAVEPSHIAEMEAFLIRAFANNLMNKKIESFRLGTSE